MSKWFSEDEQLDFKCGQLSIGPGMLLAACPVLRYITSAKPHGIKVMQTYREIMLWAVVAF